MVFLLLAIRGFDVLMLSAKQGNHWYHDVRPSKTDN